MVIEFTDDAVDSIANFAAKVNEHTENIGARRLQTRSVPEPKVSDLQAMNDGSDPGGETGLDWRLSAAAAAIVGILMLTAALLIALS